MDSAAVRVQLPGGEAFAPAFVEAVERYAGRRGFSSEGTAGFVSILEPAMVAVRTAAPSAVELAVTDEGGAIRTELRGIAPRQRVGEAACDDLDAAVDALDEVDTVHVDMDAAIVQFTIVID